MPIPVTCLCGKRFAAVDSWAGKRAQCPVCGQAITIPASGDQSATAATAPAIVVACRCGQRFQAGAHLAGKQLACPQCGNALLVQAEMGIDSLLGDMAGAQAFTPPQMPPAFGQGTMPRATYPQYSAAPSPGNKPWGLILGVGGGVVLLGVLVFVGLGAYRMAMKHMPREYPRSSKFPTAFMEQQWKQLNPGEVKWETYSPSGTFTLEWPSTKAVPFPRNGFDSLTLMNARALGPEGPYFAVMSSSASLLSHIHGKTGDPPQEVLQTALKIRQLLPKGNLARSSDIQINGKFGKEMTFTETIDGQPIVIHVRMIVAGEHLYAIWVGGLESSLKDEEVRRFLDSFRLTEKGASAKF